MNNLTPLEQGIELWGSVAETLNTIIKRDGKIDINDREIWDNILHSWQNEDWELAIVAVATLYNEYPNYFKKFHIDALKEAGRTLLKHKDTTERVLDKRMYKALEWKMIMTMRELWNACRDEYIPNDNSARKLNEFRKLFDA